MIGDVIISNRIIIVVSRFLFYLFLRTFLLSIIPIFSSFPKPIKIGVQTFKRVVRISSCNELLAVVIAVAISVSFLKEVMLNKVTYSFIKKYYKQITKRKYEKGDVKIEMRDFLYIICNFFL